jgi:glycerophosphoryl diester phosphodiesterase
VLLPRISLGGGARPGHRYFAGAPLLVAHRGGSRLAPENTLTAFRRAVEWWRADFLELDVQPTRDGEAVVFHDATLDRTTEATGPVADRPLDALRQLDTGYRFTPDGGRTHPFRDRGVGISTLDEVLEALPGTRLNVEIKDARAQQGVLRAIRRHGAEHRVLIASGRRRCRTRFRDYAGPQSAPAEELAGFLLMLRAGLPHLFRPRTDAFQVPETWHGRRVVDPAWVRAAHSRNVPVHVWTVDEEADMRRLLAWGVDAIMTDRPDRLARVLHQTHGRPLPPGPPAEAVEPWLERVLLA